MPEVDNIQQTHVSSGASERALGGEPTVQDPRRRILPRFTEADTRLCGEVDRGARDRSMSRTRAIAMLSLLGDQGYPVRPGAKTERLLHVSVHDRGGAHWARSEVRSQSVVQQAPQSSFGSARRLDDRAELGVATSETQRAKRAFGNAQEPPLARWTPSESGSQFALCGFPGGTSQRQRGMSGRQSA